MAARVFAALLGDLSAENIILFIMTVAYITVLDTFTPYDAAYAVIRIVFIGFLMMGLLYMERIRLTEHIAFKKD